MSNIILRSFNSVGHIIREEAEIEKFKWCTPTAPPKKKTQNQGLSHPMHQCLVSLCMQSFNLVGQVIRKEIEIEDFKDTPPQMGSDGQDRDGCKKTGMGVRGQ